MTDHHKAVAEYHNTMRSMGYSDEDIHHRLVSAGWDRATLHEHLPNVQHPDEHRTQQAKSPWEQRNWRVGGIVLVSVVFLCIIAAHLHGKPATNLTAQRGLVTALALPKVGETQYADGTTVQLSLSCPAADTCITVSFSNDNAQFSTPQPFSKTASWQLSASDGTKQVFARITTSNHQTLTDNLGFVLDTKSPVVALGKPSVDTQKSTVTFAASTSESADCKFDTTQRSYASLATSFKTLTPMSFSATTAKLAPGKHTFWVICQDQAGNVSSPVSTSVTIVAVPSPITTAPSAATPAAVQLTEETGICHTDSTQVPSMAKTMLQFDTVCEQNYNKILSLLKTSSPVGAPHNIIMLPKTQYGVAYVQYETVYLDSTWFSANPTDSGAVVHELTHVAQDYTTGPSWVTEGMADYVRFTLGYATSWSYFHCGSSDTYSSGYNCTAAFFNFVRKNYNANVVPDIHSTMRAGTYTDQFWVNETGHTAQDLYTKCLQSDCKGGKPS